LQDTELKEVKRERERERERKREMFAVFRRAKE
jgi:hypothetical protein